MTSGDSGVPSVPVLLRTGREDSVAAAPYRTACAAPAIQLRFDPNGLVTTCCKTLRPLGHITRQRLPEIWKGAQRRRVESALEVDDFSEGCQRCGAEIAQEGRQVSYAAIHDEWAGHLTADPSSRAWPVRMEFNLSNSCNLQCIQCDGDSSSSIRLHREGRPALPKVYGDEFFEDLRDFLPHLDRIVFAGGEPFLGAENFRVWDMIADEAPHLDCMVVTNATQWTPRIERLLQRLRFSFIFSLDGISKATYESIRIGADFDEVMANVDRFRAYAARVGTTTSINHCLMPQNVHEFGSLLTWAEERDLHVDVSVVRTPAHASLARLDLADIREVDELLAAQDQHVRPRLRRNLATWDGERSRIASWARSDGAEAGANQSILSFRCAGSGRHDDASAIAELSAWSVDGAVHVVGVGADDIIRSARVGFLDDPTVLVGCNYQEFTKAIVARYGNMNHYEVTATSDDRLSAQAVFGEVPARVVTVAVRGEDGWADEARILVAFGTP